MSYLNALLVAEARRRGRAVRSALLRHRRIVAKPLGMVLWQLGAEPFTAAAVAWGFQGEPRALVAPGEPRNRDLAFRALLDVARAFNPWFEGGSPQIVVPNGGNLSLLSRLGRRLAYLPLEGPFAADPALVRFGHHLRFVTERARHPGQQSILVLTDLLASHWASELSSLESRSLPALDAVIDPGEVSAQTALLAAERIELGPAPSAADDERVDPRITELHRLRRGSTEEAVIAPLRAPIEAHYASLVDRAWPLMWRCLDRERSFPEAPSVARRWAEDVDAHARHIDWVTEKGGAYRKRQTSAAAARTLRAWEEAERLTLAEEAIDDRLRMIPYLLTSDAIAGRVTAADAGHVEPGRRRPVRRPLFELATEEPCLAPVGKALYWTETPRAPEYTIVEVRGDPRSTGSLVTLRHETGADWARPAIGQDVIFSTHHLHRAPLLVLPAAPPWSHTPKVDPDLSLEEGEDADHRGDDV